MARLLALVAFLALLAGSCRETMAFSSSQIHTQREQPTDTDISTAASPRAKDTELRASLFDDIGKFFFDAMGGGKNDDDSEASNQRNDGDSEDEDEDESEYAGSTRLLTIPAKSIKPGGLRLLLMFYCMGMQNTPESNSWKADQPNRDEYVVDMFFHDRTAMLTIKLTEDEITINRIGSAPSMSYLTQESVIVDGILDELQVCVTQDNINEEDRLLQLPEPRDAIEKARESLAFS